MWPAARQCCAARGRDERVGLGLGIIVQGLFLLAYDSILAWMTVRRVWEGDA